MEVVHDLVAADGVHVGDQTLAGAEAVARKGIALPFCQRMDDLRFHTDVGDIE